MGFRYILNPLVNYAYFVNYQKISYWPSYGTKGRSRGYRTLPCSAQLLSSAVHEIDPAHKC